MDNFVKSDWFCFMHDRFENKDHVYKSFLKIFIKYKYNGTTLYDTYHGVSVDVYSCLHINFFLPNFIEFPNFLQNLARGFLSSLIIVLIFLKFVRFTISPNRVPCLSQQLSPDLVFLISEWLNSIMVSDWKLNELQMETLFAHSIKGCRPLGRTCGVLIPSPCVNTTPEPFT